VISPGSKSTRFIPETELQNRDKCDKATGISVENVKVEATKANATASDPSPAPPPPATDYRTIPATSVEIKSPPGWTAAQKGEWGLLGSPDKKALLAFVNFDRPGESTKKLGDVAVILNTSSIKWGNPKSISVGPDGFPAQIADGTCRFPSGDGFISYATVNPGGVQQVLVVYAVEKDAPAERQKEAVATLMSMRRKK
jgi:hypothetical protein